jgi:hypothetical protein
LHAVSASVHGIAASRCLPAIGDIAVVGLSNDPRLLHRNITCCVPDWERLGYLLAHAAMGDMPVAHSSQGFVRAAALTLERATA